MDAFLTMPYFEAIWALKEPTYLSDNFGRGSIIN
jgi:hypothetical protein